MTTTPTDAQARILGVVAGWMDDEVRRLMSSGLSAEEAARVHNRLLTRLRIDDLIARLLDPEERAAVCIHFTEEGDGR